MLIFYFHIVHLVTTEMAHGSATLVDSWRFSPEWLFPRLQKLRHTALSEEREERPEVGFGGRVASRAGGGFRREREKGQLKQASRVLPLSRQKT